MYFFRARFWSCFGFLLLCFPCFSAFVLLCRSSAILLLLFFSHVFLLLYFLLNLLICLLYLCLFDFFFSFPVFSPVCVLNETPTIKETLKKS